MTAFAHQQVLDIPVHLNGEDMPPVLLRDLLITLLHKTWTEGESFDGKRPFGNSDWQKCVYIALGKAGVYVDFDSDEFEYREANKIVADAIEGALVAFGTVREDM